MSQNYTWLYHEIGRCGDNMYLSGKYNLVFSKLCGVAQTCMLDHVGYISLSYC